MNLDHIVAQAQQQTGLTKLGDNRILEALRRLVDAFNPESLAVQARREHQECYCIWLQETGDIPDE